MDRIKLTKKEKQILRAIRDNKYPANAHPEDVNDLIYLREVGLIHGANKIPNSLACIHLADYGKAYFTYNPKLKNPSIWQDKKYIITTAISLIALAISIIALIKN